MSVRVRRNINSPGKDARVHLPKLLLAGQAGIKESAGITASGCQWEKKKSHTQNARKGHVPNPDALISRIQLPQPWSLLDFGTSENEPNKKKSLTLPQM